MAITVHLDIKASIALIRANCGHGMYMCSVTQACCSEQIVATASTELHGQACIMMMMRTAARQHTGMHGTGVVRGPVDIRWLFQKQQWHILTPAHLYSSIWLF